MRRLIIEFPDDGSIDAFLGWFADGGGDQQFFMSEDYRASDDNRKPIGRFSYERAFPAWGYDPAKHGADLTVVAHHAANET